MHTNRNKKSSRLYNLVLVFPPIHPKSKTKNLKATQGNATEGINDDKMGSSSTASEAEAAATIQGKKKRESILDDKRMQRLFVLFDRDGDHEIDFKEVAIGLYQLTKCVDQAKANTSASMLLLMLDKDEKRTLSYEQFSKLILGVAVSLNMTFAELYTKLVKAMEEHSTEDISQDVLDALTVAEETYTQQMESKAKERKTLDALSYSRTLKLFDIWDTNGDGTIDFQELLTGLRKYQKSVDVQGNVEKDALRMMGHDDDDNHALDKEEFAHAIADYAEAVDRELHELIDYMCVVSAACDTTKYEICFKSATKCQKDYKFEPCSLGTILDMGEEEEEEEEDDW